MADPSVRFERMLSLLPRILTAQPETSAIGALLRSIAGALGTVDDDLVRLLHDRWLGLATGESPPGGEPSALERLGGLLSIPRFPQSDSLAPKVAAANGIEVTEAYRRRLALTAQAMTRGLTAPRALLDLAIATLGAAPCARVERDIDTTLAWGMPTAVRKLCPVCQGRAQGPCPNREQAVLQAWITDCPLTPASLVRSDVRIGAAFTVASDSRTIDRPVLRLRANRDQDFYCAVQNRGTGEITLYAGPLRQDEQVTILSTLDPDERAVFATHEEVSDHPWLAQSPQGRAFVSMTDGSVRDASRSIYYVSGFRFDAPDSTFAELASAEGTRFGRLGQEIRTPRVRPGSDDWVILAFARPDSPFDDPMSTFAADGAEQGTRFGLFDGTAGDTGATQASMLFESFAKTRTGTEQTASLDIELDWLARPPVTFRMRIPLTDAVRKADALGALAAVHAELQHARAAGVRALVDFPEPPIRESQPLADVLALNVALRWQEHVTAREGAMAIAAQRPIAERQSSSDGALVIGPAFDGSRFDDAQFAVVRAAAKR